MSHPIKQMLGVNFYMEKLKFYQPVWSVAPWNRNSNHSVLKKAPEPRKDPIFRQVCPSAICPFVLCCVWCLKGFSPGCKWMWLLGVAVATKLQGGFSKWGNSECVCVLVQIKNTVKRGKVEISSVVLITAQMTSAVSNLCDLALMPVSLVCSGAHWGRVWRLSFSH